MKRLFAGLMVALLALTVTTLVTTQTAEAQNCNPPFAPSITFPEDNSTLTADEFIILFGGGSNETALATAQTLVGTTADAQRFLVEIIDYLTFLVSGRCAPLAEYEGPYTNHPTTAPGPYGFGTMSPVAAAADAVTPESVPATTDGGGALAHTGSESTVLAYVGLGLLGFGTAAMGSRRRIR